MTNINKGDYSELLFDVKVTSLGLNVCKPVSSATAYDRIVDNGDCLLKIQIKSVSPRISKKNGKGYYDFKFRRKNGDMYDNIDFFCILLLDTLEWLIVPLVEYTTRGKSLFKFKNDWSRIEKIQSKI